MTIKDIARISGCSVSTISRVINDRPDVRPETKEHVLRIMREVGFVPNTNARQLKIQQSRSVVFVVKGTQNMFFADFLVHLQHVVGLYGYSGIVSYLDENANEMEAAEKILREIKPKGIIFLGGNVENFRQSFDSITGCHLSDRQGPPEDLRHRRANHQLPQQNAPPGRPAGHGGQRPHL